MGFTRLDLPRTGTRRPDGEGARSGFSMVEIMIALAIVGFVGGMVVINYGSLTKSERLKSAARKLAGLSAYVRSQATGSKRKAYIEFDFVENRYRTVMDPLQDDFGRFIDTEDRHILSEDELEEWKESFDWDDLPRDVYFRKLFLSNKTYYDSKSGIVTADYNPDGSVQSYILWIQGAADEGQEGRYYSIIVNGLNGSAEVLEGAASYPEAVESDFTAVMGPDAPGGAGEKLSPGDRK